MWTVEIERIKSLVKHDCESFNTADAMLESYMSPRGLTYKESYKIWDTIGTIVGDNSTVGTLKEECGELFFEDSGAYHGSYRIYEH